MIKIDFKPRYRTLHLVNELGTVFHGGVHTYISEHYRYRDDETGFILYQTDNQDYVGQPDVAIVTDADAGKLEWLDYDTLILHHYEYNHFLTDRVLQTKRVIFHTHGMPTPEPTPKDFPFGGHVHAEQMYKGLCQCAAHIVCGSHCEAAKLARLCPEFADKIHIIPIGITIPPGIKVAPPRMQRTRLGHISRLDYRKGLLETLKAIRGLPSVELHIACNMQDKRYMILLNDYIAATGIGDRLHWHGFCVGERKAAFFDYVDAVVVPSLWEPFGYTAIEPLIYGKPVIVANNSGMAEIVGPDYAYQFNPFSIREHFEMIERCLNDPPATVFDETRQLMARLPLFDGKKMVEDYRAFLTAL